MRKHVYKVIINCQEEKSLSYMYDYGNTKKIILTISKEAICIIAELAKEYDRHEILTYDGYLFPDAIKKALLIHLIKFSVNIMIKTILVQIDDDLQVVIDSEKGQIPPICSMVVGELQHPFTEKWNYSSIEGILTQTKSSYDSRTASLFALICSKNKRYEAERFIYLWMSINGMYSYFAKLVSETHDNIRIRKEYKQIQYFQRLFEIGDETIADEKEKRRIAQEVALLIKNNPCSITKAFLQSEKGMDFSKKIEALLVNPKNNKHYKISPYGYLLTQFSYYYRCNLVHADKPLALFSYSNEPDIHCLRTINELLEEFIEQNLNLWFSREYVDTKLRSLAKKIEIKEK